VTEVASALPVRQPRNPWMPEAVLRRDGYVLAAAWIAALAFGVLLPIAPRTAVAAFVVIPFALAAPAASTAVLIAVTVLVPFDLQEAFKVTGGRGEPGLLLIDALMLLGLLRIGWLLLRKRLPLDLPLLAGAGVGLIYAAALGWGLVRGWDVSEAGHEARRAVLGVAAFLLVWPLMANRTARRRLVWVLITVGLALGIWGLAQWLFVVAYTDQGDVGVRAGVDLTSAGRGQLQGGMYAYPVAVTLAWAALVMGRIQRVPVKWLLAAILFLNAVCLLVTFERTLWVATVIACVLVVVMSGGAAARPALKWAGAGVACMTVLAALSPGEARSAVERLLSVHEASSDNSLWARLAESRYVIEAIHHRPITGSGFGATITWGVRDTFGTVTTTFSHNGYLWLSWKIGIPAAALVVLLIVGAILRRTPGSDTADWRALRRGSQASLVAVLLICVMFPVFNALGITALIGLLVAVAYSGEPEDSAARAASAGWSP
jgi:O-antigen ligase